MEKTIELLKTVFIGAIKSTYTTVKRLSKIIIPVIFLTTFIEMTGILAFVSKLFEPVMQLFNLPGQASLPLILGAFVNIYASLPAIESLDLTPPQITTIAIMILLCHSLLVETAIITSIGVKRRTQIIIRVSAAVIAGMIVGSLLGGLYG